MVGAKISTTVTIATTASVVLLAMAVTALWQRKRRRQEKIPEKWRRIGTLSELTLYPLKSGAPLRLEEGECTEIGIKTTPKHEMRLQDRLFVVVGLDGNMRSARQHGDLFFIKASRADEVSVTFQAPNMEDLTVPIPKAEEAKKVTLEMHRKEKCLGLDCGDEAALWIQKYLGKEGLRLVYYDVPALGRRDHTRPPFNQIMKVYRNFHAGDSGTYTDFASYMLINEASVADLKKRLGEKAPPTLSARWFRPTLIISDAEAYAEDEWNFLRIGENAVFQVTKPCTRCIMSNIDPATGKKTSNMEPLKTLRTYRQVTDPKLLTFELSTAPIMGLYVGLRRPGCIRTGDAVYVPDE